MQMSTEVQIADAARCCRIANFSEGGALYVVGRRIIPI
jgi:hypothetical protein